MCRSCPASFGCARSEDVLCKVMLALTVSGLTQLQSHSGARSTHASGPSAAPTCCSRWQPRRPSLGTSLIHAPVCHPFQQGAFFGLMQHRWMCPWCCANRNSSILYHPRNFDSQSIFADAQTEMNIETRNQGSTDATTSFRL